MRTVRQTATKEAVLLARANICRSLVRDGHIDGPLALSFVIDPPDRLRTAETQLPGTTINARAHGRSYHN